MSTASLRERLRRIKLQTAQHNEATGTTNLRDGADKENTNATMPTDTRLVRTAPMTGGGGTNAPFVFATPSISRPATSSGIAPAEPPRHRPLSAVESASRYRVSSSAQKQQPKPICATPNHLPPRPQDRCTPAKHRSSSARERQKSDKHVFVNGHPYLVIDLIGRGGSSKVYQVLNEAQKVCQAVKCVDLSEADSATKEAYLNEIKLLLDLKDSGCVVKLIDYELRGNHLYMVMEKGDTDLATFLKTRRDKIDNIFIRFYWSEMLKCVSAIHKKGVVHSDLKPANFLLIGGNLKLIDFGIASAIPSNKTSVMKDSQMGTLSYMPPEAITGTVPQDGKEVYKVQRKSDVWSLGCILYIMVYGRTPYQQYCSSVQKINAIISKPVEFGPIDDQELLDVMKKCLVKDPEQRASVEQLQEHPYLKKEAESLDESAVFKDDTYLLKVAEDLRTCTPRTSARKLRRLMQKRGTANAGDDLLVAEQ